MSFDSPKAVRFRPWDGPSPLAAKRRRLDNGDAEDQSRGDNDAAFRHCPRCVSPIDGDTLNVALPQKLSPALEAPALGTPSLEPRLLVFAGETGETPPPTEPARQTGARFPPVSFAEPSTSDLPSGMRASLAALKADSQAARLARVKQEQSDKSTADTYQRHVDRYEKWWVGYQVERASTTPGWTAIPAFPITAAKVSMFLGYESTREKVRPPFHPFAS